MSQDYGHGAPRPGMGFRPPPPGFGSPRGPPPPRPPLGPPLGPPRVTDSAPLRHVADMYDPTDPTHGEDGEQSSGKLATIDC